LTVTWSRAAAGNACSARSAARPAVVRRQKVIREPLACAGIGEHLESVAPRPTMIIDLKSDGLAARVPSL
jgi:hypothetical protein